MMTFTVEGVFKRRLARARSARFSKTAANASLVEFLAELSLNVSWTPTDSGEARAHLILERVYIDAVYLPHPDPLPLGEGKSCAVSVVAEMALTR
jgi:hypothetical protein